MNSKPILFSSEMVRAILEGRKTQTRRVMKPQPSDDFSPVAVEWYSPIIIDRHGDEQPGNEIFGVYGDEEGYRCPYGAPGDQLWVKETFGAVGSSFVYKADCLCGDADEFVEFNTGITVPAKWKPSRFMPRTASRITLEIVKVRVERIQEISELDARAEGIVWQKDFGNGIETRDARGPFIDLWHVLNDPRGFGWNVNPWVWVIEFKRVASK